MPVDNVAANSAATSAWANSVADAVNAVEDDIYAAGQLAIPWASVTGKPATFTPIVGPSVATTSYGLAKTDGDSPNAARANHTHGTPALPTPAQLAIPWTEVTGKPTAFTPAAHKTTHATGGADALTAADIGAAAAYDSPATLDPGKRVYVGSSTPTGASEGDIWIQR